MQKCTILFINLVHNELAKMINHLQLVDIKLRTVKVDMGTLNVIF